MSKSKAAKGKSSSSKSQTATAPSASSKTIPYKAVDRGPLKPTVELVLHAVSDGRILPAVRALVDSGADQSLFPMSFMTPLGIDIADCKQVDDGQGAGGTTTYYFWPKGKIHARVGKWQMDLLAWFSATKVPLLGREDFFVMFESVTFNQKTRTFTITE